MQETIRSKPGKKNGKNVKSVGSARGSPFVQRTSIGKSKGYSVVSSDSNVPAHNKNLRQPDFNLIEHETSFPRDDIEVMQEGLRNKSGILQPSKSYIHSSPSIKGARTKLYICGISKKVEKRTLNGKSKDSKNTEYDLNELPQNSNRVPLGLDPMEDDLTLPQDEGEVMQDTRTSKT
ncbi:hypothetical protein H5410_040837, partial [Solanum commersonii]